MIERHVYLRLSADYQHAAGRAETAERARQLSRVPGVTALRVGLPADERAAEAWDLCLVVSFAQLSDVAAYIDHPDHRDFVDSFLKPRLQVIKYWNFEV